MAVSLPTPATFTVTIAGFTGVCADFNGAVTLTKLPENPFFWTGTIGTATVDLVATPAGDGYYDWELILTRAPGSEVHYAGQIFGIYSPVILTRDDVTICTGSPDTLTFTPSAPTDPFCDCPGCPNGAPVLWTMTTAGFTSCDLTTLNGSWTLTAIIGGATSCAWVGALRTGADDGFAMLDRSGGGWTITFWQPSANPFAPRTILAIYTLAGALDCTGSNTFTKESTPGCAAGPSTIAIAPGSTTTGCPTPCDDTCPEDGWRNLPEVDPWTPPPINDADNNPSPCGGCGWIADIPPKSCLSFRVAGGAGRCLCYPDASSVDEVPAIWNGFMNGWVSTKMLPTCCGCGLGLFQIDIAAEDPIATAQFKLKGVHISCQGGSGSGTGAAIFDITLKLECCGVDATGRKYVSFYGRGPDTCDDPVLDCDNVFRILVYCADGCPPATCRCVACGATVNPPSWFSSFTEFADDHNNGYWIWNQSNLESDCQWKAKCTKGVTSPATEFLSTFEYVPGVTPKWRLTHSNGAVFEKNVTSNECGSDITLTKISGDGPATVTLKPLLPIDEDSLPHCCTGIDLDKFPDAFTVTFAVNPACPLLTGSYAVTRDGVPYGPYSWSWTTSSPGPGQIGNVIVRCTFGTIEVTAVGSCSDGFPVGGSFGGIPTSISYAPFGIVLSTGATTGPIAPPNPTCCTNSSTPGTVTLH